MRQRKRNEETRRDNKWSTGPARSRVSRSPESSQLMWLAAFHVPSPTKHHCPHCLCPQSTKFRRSFVHSCLFAVNKNGPASPLGEPASSSSHLQGLFVSMCDQAKHSRGDCHSSPEYTSHDTQSIAHTHPQLLPFSTVAIQG